MTTSFGKFGEDTAVKYLQSKKYKIIARNVRNKAGEIDIVAKKGDELYLIEVKARKNITYGYPEEYVTKNKLQKIKKAGLLYKKETKKLLPEMMRILVVGVLFIDAKVKVKLTEVFD